MDTKSVNQALPAPVYRPLAYPFHTIITTVPRAETKAVAAALIAAGFTRDRFEITTAEEIAWLGERIGGSGAYGLLNRLRFSLGGALDDQGPTRLDLLNEHALVQVLVHDDLEQGRVRAILCRHGGHLMHYFGRWTITASDESRFHGD